MAEARGKPWLVVPLSVPDTVVSGYERMSEHYTIAASMETLLGKADQPFQFGPDSAQALGVYEFYDPSPGSDRLELDLRRPVVDSLHTATGHRYILAVQSVYWSKTNDRFLKELGAGLVVGAVALGLGARHLILTATPSSGKSVVMELVDARNGESITGGAVRSEDDAFEPPAQALLLNLLTGRELTPSSFDVDVFDDVIVYRYEKPSVVGTGFRVDGWEAVVERDDEADVRIPVESVKRVKSTTQNRFIFPAKEAR